jgi:hypothetical protein
MANEEESGVDWGKELQTLVSLAETPEDRKAAFAFAQALNPYLEDPTLLRTLLGKIMQSPTDKVSVVAHQRAFESLDDVKQQVGDDVKVIPL